MIKIPFLPLSFILGIDGVLATVYVLLAGYDYFLSYSGIDVVGIYSCNLFGSI